MNERRFGFLISEHYWELTKMLINSQCWWVVVVVCRQTLIKLAENSSFVTTLSILPWKIYMRVPVSG